MVGSLAVDLVAAQRLPLWKGVSRTCVARFESIGFVHFLGGDVGAALAIALDLTLIRVARLPVRVLRLLLPGR